MENFSFIVDSALEKKDFLQFKDYLRNTAIYRTIEADENKKFYVTDTPYGLEEKITQILQKVWNRPIKVMCGFVRKATKFLDTNWAIHCDLYVGGDQSPEHGAVFYISQNSTELTGTALWKHKELGRTMPREFNKDKVMKISDRDYNNIDKWELDAIASRYKNFIKKYFHSRS